MAATWIEVVIAALGGGVIVKLFEYAYAEYRRRSEVAASAAAVVNQQLDPILKAADELVGKLRSLADKDFTDFRELTEPPNSTNKLNLSETVTLGNMLYLFGQFWARLEILRRESLYVRLSADKTGAKLREFVRCLESKKVRLFERAWQRGIGESLISSQVGQSDCINFHQFMESYMESPDLRRWFQPLQKLILLTAYNKEQRQRVLQYGVILHALIDTLDSDHLTTGNRPSFPNKLSKKTQRELERRVFRIYLPFVENTSKYTG